MNEFEKPSERTWAAWKPVATIMRTDVARVAPDCDRTTLVALFHARNVGEALVVDGDGKPIGFVERTALTRPGSCAAALMSPVTFTLNEAIPLSLAAALMASAGVSLVPIVSATSGTVGLLGSRELLCWIARQAGHRVVDAATVLAKTGNGKDPP